MSDAPDLRPDAERADSLRRRFVFKLTGNVLGAVTSVVMAAVVPRVLGVENYGNYTFLLATLTQVLVFLDLRTSYCFITKVAQRPDERALVSFYARVAASVVGLFALGVVAVTATSLHERVFLGQQVRHVFLAAGLVVLIWSNSVLGQTFDALGRTVWLEKVQILFKAAVCGVLVGIAIADLLTLESLFAYQCATQLALFTVFCRALRATPAPAAVTPPPADSGRYAREFYDYCLPLVLTVALGFAAQLADRWLVQLFGGARQQGLYSFSMNLANIGMLLPTAMLPLLNREVAIQSSAGSRQGMADLLHAIVPPIYAANALLTGFLFVQADHLAVLFGGTKYADASTILRIAAFLPLTFASGHLHSAFFYGTGRTRTYFVLSVVTTPIGVISTWLLLRQGLGGSALAWKDVVLGMFNCLVYLVVNLRFLRVLSWSAVLHFALSPAVFVGLAVGARSLAERVVAHGGPAFLTVAGLAYVGLAALAVWVAPWLVGRDRAALVCYLEELARRIRTGVSGAP